MVDMSCRQSRKPDSGILMSLLRGSFVPDRGFFEGRTDALSKLIAESKVELGDGVSLLSRKTEPPNGFLRVALYPVALVVAEPETTLRTMSRVLRRQWEKFSEPLPVDLTGWTRNVVLVGV